MKLSIQDVSSSIQKLNDTFTSHQFIKAFVKEHEDLYLDAISANNKGRGTFQIVHSQIGKFLLDNANALRITPTRKVESENIFGDTDTIQEWQKINHY